MVKHSTYFVMASSCKDDSLGSLLSLPSREGNYASILCTSTGRQETDQGLTLSPKISLKDSCHSRSDPRLSKKELDALLGLVQCGFHNSENQKSQQVEPHSKRRKLNKKNDDDNLFDEELMNTQYELVSQQTTVKNVMSSNIEVHHLDSEKNHKENEAEDNRECSSNNDTTQNQPDSLAETHASDPRLHTASESDSPHAENNELADEVSLSQNGNQSLYQKIVSSFPISCLLEIAGSGRDSILALILELATYDNYRDSSPGYEIPNTYRCVFDELCAQWSRGTTKNEFRKAFLAYIKEKLEVQMSTEEVGKNIGHNISGLFGESTSESKSLDALARCIEEVGLIQESSKNLLRHIFGQARGILNQLKDLNIKLQTENVKLRTDLSKISEKLREIETQNQVKESNPTSFNCINPVLDSSQDEIFKDLDCADLFGDTEEIDLNQDKETNDDLWICCERNVIADGQSIPETNENNEMGETWRTHDSCMKCMRANNEKRFYIIREQVVSAGWEKFREIANVYAETGKVVLPNISSKLAQENFSPATNTIDELIPSLSDAIPLSESTFWDIDPAQAAAWSTQISDSALGLESQTMERLTLELDRENPYDVDYNLNMERKENLHKIKVTNIGK
ncbi:hypothetical protein OnM2_080019 [Erysiphe neolycopersici]|uniref:Uncharacterized protein n=1 Tax=Erysiphe neolycopersici TaxID=212602 RepID=A0A420HGT3_9PEZI|nr:hypothetical protein OnM2_080019 [Erysiphe neolycopersici]